MSDTWSAVVKHHERFLAYALRIGARPRKWIARQGHDIGELHPHALVNHVWELVLAGKWDPEEKPVHLFFFHEIRNRVRNLERGARRAHLRIVGSDPVPGQELGADDLPGSDRALQIMIEQLDWADLMAFIADRKPVLARLADLIVQGYSCSEQAAMLGISVATRLRWQNELAKLILQYRDGDAA